MGAVDRIARVNEILKREIADLIERGGIAPSSSVLVSVVEVKTSSDLRNEEIKQEVLKNLHKNRKDLQKKVSRDVVLKYTPILDFKLDDRLEAGDKVLSMLEELGDDSE
jgi:ribosome-binding factor A